MAPKAEKLVERAQNGERLTRGERLHAIGYLMAVSPQMSNVDMAELFRVSEKQIRDDRRKIRDEKAKAIREEDIGLVIADIALSFDNQVRDLEKSKIKAKQGERTYMEHCKSIFDMQLRKIKALQELGFYPKSLGNLTIEKFEYAAVVGKDGSVAVRPVEFQMPKELESGEPQMIDAEFTELRSLPAPSGAADGSDSSPRSEED
jgi:hypothetical protein